MASPQLPLPRLVFFSKSVTEPSFVESLHLALKSGTEYRYRQTPSVEDVKEVISRSTRVVWLANVATKEEIVEIYPLFAAFESRIMDGTLKILILNSARHPKLRDLVRARPGVEVIDLPITTKALQYKLKNGIISAHQNYLKIAEIVDTSITIGSDAKTALRTRPRVLGAEVLWQPATEFDYDFWWIPDGKSIRLVVGVWLIDIIGPSMTAGTWEPVPDFDSQEEKAWVWKSRWLADEVFQTREGRWIFFGRQVPEYSPTKNTWLFMGKEPRLSYFPADSNRPKFTRFEYRDEEGFTASENSATAKTLLPLIQSTFVTVIQPTKDGEVVAAKVGDDYDEFELPTDPLEGTPAALILRGSSDTAKRSGLDDVEQPGVTAGKLSFARTSIGAEILRKNGELLTNQRGIPLVYDVTKTGATFSLDYPEAEVGDRFHFRLKVASGEVMVDCIMEWELRAIEMSFDGKIVARGDFVSGDFAPLAHAVEQVQTRRRELKEFFRLSRG